MGKVYGFAATLPARLFSGLTGFGGIAASLYPENIKVRIAHVMATGDIRLIGVCAVAITVVYWLLLWKMKPSDNKTARTAEYSAASPNSQAFSAETVHIYNSAPERKKASQLSEEQINQIKDVELFLIEKDEMSLRTTFEFPDMLSFNIRKATGDLNPRLISEAEADQINRYFLGGQAKFSLDYANITFVNGTPQYAPKPGMFGMMNMPANYVQARAHLQRLSNSAFLPDKIRQSIADIDEEIEKNTTLILEIINHRLAQDPFLVFRESDYGTKYYGATSSLYWSKFGNLRPLVDRLALAVRAFLNEAGA